VQTDYKEQHEAAGTW